MEQWFAHWILLYDPKAPQKGKQSRKKERIPGQKQQYVLRIKTVVNDATTRNDGGGIDLSSLQSEKRPNRKEVAKNYVWQNFACFNFIAYRQRQSCKDTELIASNAYVHRNNSNNFGSRALTHTHTLHSIFKIDDTSNAKHNESRKDPKVVSNPSVSLPWFFHRAKIAQWTQSHSRMHNRNTAPLRSHTPH